MGVRLFKDLCMKDFHVGICQETNTVDIETDDEVLELTPDLAIEVGELMIKLAKEVIDAN